MEILTLSISNCLSGCLPKYSAFLFFPNHKADQFGKENLCLFGTILINYKSLLSFLVYLYCNVVPIVISLRLNLNVEDILNI